MKNIITKLNRKFFIATFIIASLFIFTKVLAATPVGADTFQLLISPATGLDNTGDAGTGVNADFNYYYVGQSANMQMEIKSGGTDAANIWVDFITTKLNLTGLTTGTYYPSWAGQTIVGNRLKSTGYRTTGTSSGTGDFGGFTLNFTEPTEANYGTTTPTTLDVNIGTVGGTTESNISLLGNDILDDEEDFALHIWADTKKPYAKNEVPLDTATNISVTDFFTFDLRDSLNGISDAGVGTGLNLSTGNISINTVSMNAYDSYSCSGTWGTNLCSATVNPPSPSAIPGDTRNWDYNTTYTVLIEDFQDLASALQNQLGDTNGPNIMNPTTFTFTTEADIVAPQVTYASPASSATGVSVSANLTIEVQDRKTYPNGASGVGLDATTCEFNLSSSSLPLTTFNSLSPEISTSVINYGSQFVINPTFTFAENEVVTVSVFNCEDLAGNVMTTDTWTFTTSDTGAPYVDQLTPASDGVLNSNGTISFHVKDDAGGVSLNDLVIYLNGVYYTNGGGPKTVTTTGTVISTLTSLDFNGTNYLGDTTSISGTAFDYTLILDPQINFTAGEGVTLIVYAKDASGNIMPRVVYEYAPGATGSCALGSTYCGTNTSWNGAMCIGVGGGTGGSSSGGGAYRPIEITTSSAVQIDEDSILINYYTSQPAMTWVLYDVKTPQDYGTAPDFNYSNRTVVNTEQTMFHSFQIDGLKPGQLYSILPVAQKGDEYARGSVLNMAPAFHTKYIETVRTETKVVEVIGPERVVIRETRNDGTQEKVAEYIFKIKNIDGSDIDVNEQAIVQIEAGKENFIVSGIGRPGEELLVISY